MITLTNLYDDYIDRPKLTEQKNPFEYIVPPSPLKWGSEQLNINWSSNFTEPEQHWKIKQNEDFIKNIK